MNTLDPLNSQFRQFKIFQNLVEDPLFRWCLFVVNRVNTSGEANMRGALERPINHKNMVTETMNIYDTAGN